MKEYIHQLSDISKKIENYNNIITRIEQILGADYRYVLSLLNQDGVITTKGNEKLFTKISAALSTFYYGWFESLDLQRSWDDYTVNAIYDKPTKTFTIDSMKRIMTNDYNIEYSRCYKTGELDEIEFLDLAIKIIENKIEKIHRFSVAISQSKSEVDNNNKVKKLTSEASTPDIKLFMLLTLTKNTNMDLNYFQNMLQKLLDIKKSLIFNQASSYLKGINEESIAELDTLLSVLPVYMLTNDEIEFIKYLLNPIISDEIIRNYANYSIVTIPNNVTKNEKRKSLTNQPLN